MGGFIIARNNSDKIIPEKALNIFQRKKQKISKEAEYGGYKIFIFNKRSFNNPNYFSFDDGFLAMAGTPVYKNLSGEKAASQLFSDFKKKQNLNFSDFHGHFCFIIGISQKLYLFNDFNGVYHFYHDDDFNIISNSFLAVSEALKEKRINDQGIYEYVIYGTIFGGDTVVKNIRQQDCSKIVRLLPELSLINKQVDENHLPKLSYENSIKVVSENLVNYFKILTNNYNDITLGLSGGLDSRLILALLLKNDIKPFIYTHGSPDSHEVNISRSICKAFNLEFRNYHEKPEEEPGKEKLNEIVSEKFLIDDGFNMFGVFYSTKTKDIELSQIRKLNLNGMGGEIYRTRWQLPDRNIDFDYFLKVRYLINFQDELVSAGFNKNLFFKKFLGKIKNSINKEDSKLTPPMTNLIYPQFKMRYWAGRTISKLNQFCYSILPFGEPRLYLQSIWLPANYKVAGRFEAGLIKNINPELARFKSNYLFNFYDGPDLRARLMEWSKIYSPVFIKKTTPGFIRHLVRSKRSVIPDNLRITKERGNSVFGNQELQIKEYINTDRITTQDMYSRILTLEFYFKNYLN